MADFANPLAPGNQVGVFGGKWMPSDAVRFSRSSGARPSAAQNVLAVRDRLKVRRVTAKPVPAKMVEHKARRNGAVGDLVCNAVRPLYFSVRSPSGLHAAVAAEDGRSGPDVTPRLGIDHHVRGEPFAKWHQGSFHTHNTNQNRPE